jgi:pimeloyl-ACP methyl ester carboxylesterase
MNNSILGISGIGILAFALAGCTAHPSASSRVPAGAKAGDLRLEPRMVKMKSGKSPADRGTLIVPENRSKADSRLIALPVIRIRATGKNPGEPIFYLAGGPGISNMRGLPPAGLLINHDFVMIGYRGVDGSVALNCPEISKAIKGDGHDVLSEQSLAGMSSAMRQAARRLQSQGVDLDGYTIAEVVADMEAGRAALGYERVHLLSASYGTRVAQVYAYQYPARIHRSVMVGVNPPGRFVWEPSKIDSQIEYYSKLYSQTRRGRTADLAATMRALAHHMPSRWMFFHIDPGKVRSVTFAMLFHRKTAAMAFDAWLAAQNGDPSGLALMSMAYDFIIPGMGVYGEFYSKGASADYDPNRDYFVEMDPDDSIIGSPLAKLIWGSVSMDGKPAWPTSLLPRELRRAQISDVETLLISGNLDFSTPAEYATDELLPRLTNGRQVILSDMGHVGDLMTFQPEAIERLLAGFFDTGVADDSLFKHLPMEFHVKAGFPLIAKAALGAAVLIIPALVAGAWFLTRRIRRSIKRRRSL